MRQGWSLRAVLIVRKSPLGILNIKPAICIELGRREGSSFSLEAAEHFPGWLGMGTKWKLPEQPEAHGDNHADDAFLH